MGIIWESFKNRIKDSKKWSDFMGNFRNLVSRTPKVSPSLEPSSDNSRSLNRWRSAEFIEKMRRRSMGLYNKKSALIPRMRRESFVLFNRGNPFIPREKDLKKKPPPPAAGSSDSAVVGGGSREVEVMSLRPIPESIEDDREKTGEIDFPLIHRHSFNGLNNLGSNDTGDFK
jgi:hypothetical protein